LLQSGEAVDVTENLMDDLRNLSRLIKIVFTGPLASAFEEYLDANR